MNALTRWNQLKELEALRHGLGSLLNRSPAQWPEGQEEPMAVAEWSPLVDISEDDKDIRLAAGRCLRHGGADRRYLLRRAEGHSANAG